MIVNDELRAVRRELAVVYLKVLTLHLLGGIGGKSRKTISIDGHRAEYQTRYI
jgi:hypothetical protein